jgi:hypothetical protein
MGDLFHLPHPARQDSAYCALCEPRAAAPEPVLIDHAPHVAPFVDVAPVPIPAAPAAPIAAARDAADGAAFRDLVETHNHRNMHAIRALFSAPARAPRVHREAEVTQAERPAASPRSAASNPSESETADNPAPAAAADGAAVALGKTLEVATPHTPAGGLAVHLPIGEEVVAYSSSDDGSSSDDADDDSVEYSGPASASTEDDGRSDTRPRAPPRRRCGRPPIPAREGDKCDWHAGDHVACGKEGAWRTGRELEVVFCEDHRCKWCLLERVRKAENGRVKCWECKRGRHTSPVPDPPQLKRLRTAADDARARARAAKRVRYQ